MTCIVMGVLYFGNPLKDIVSRDIWIPISIMLFILECVFFTGILQFVYSSNTTEIGNSNRVTSAGIDEIDYIPPYTGETEEGDKELHGWMVISREGGNSNLPTVFPGNEWLVYPFIPGIIHRSNKNKKIMAKFDYYPNAFLPHWISPYFYTAVRDEDGNIKQIVWQREGFNFWKSRVYIAFEVDYWAGGQLERFSCPKCKEEINIMATKRAPQHSNYKGMTLYYEALISKYVGEVQRVKPFGREPPKTEVEVREARSEVPLVR